MRDSERQDTFLFSELKAGNPRAFDKIFKSLYPILSRYACSILHDHDKSQSLVQEVFVRLWENRFSLDHVRNLPAYLTSMVHNESLNYLRHEKKNVSLASFPPGLKVEESDQQSMGASDFMESLVAALSNLPSRCREAFEMSRFENMTNVEIAAKMGISVKGVEALMTRTLKILRRSLSDFFPSSDKKDLSGSSILFLFIKRNKTKAHTLRK